MAEVGPSLSTFPGFYFSIFLKTTTYHLLIIFFPFFLYVLIILFHHTINPPLSLFHPHLHFPKGAKNSSCGQVEVCAEGQSSYHIISGFERETHPSICFDGEMWVGWKVGDKCG